MIPDPIDRMPGHHASKERPMSQTTTTRPEPFVSEGTSPPSSAQTTPAFRARLHRSPVPGLWHAAGRPPPCSCVTRCFGPLRRPTTSAACVAGLTREAARRTSCRPSGASRSCCRSTTFPTGGLRVGDSPLDAGAPTGRLPRAGAAVGQGRLAEPDALVQGPRRRRRRGTRRRVRLHHARVRQHRQPRPPRSLRPPRPRWACARWCSSPPTSSRPRSPRPGRWARRSCAWTAPMTRSTGCAWS